MEMLWVLLQVSGSLECFRRFSYSFISFTLFQPQQSDCSKSHPEPESRLQPVPQLQLTEQPQHFHQLQQQNPLQPGQQLLNTERQKKSVWVTPQRLFGLLLVFFIGIAILGLAYYLHHVLHTGSGNNAANGRPPEPIMNSKLKWITSLSNCPFTVSYSNPVCFYRLSVGFCSSVHVHWPLHPGLWLLCVHVWFKKTPAQKQRETKKSRYTGSFTKPDWKVSRNGQTK